VVDVRRAMAESPIAEAEPQRFFRAVAGDSGPREAAARSRALDDDLYSRSRNA